MFIILALLATSQTTSPNLTLNDVFSGEYYARGGPRLGPWMDDGKTMLAQDEGGLTKIDAATGKETLFVSAKQLTPAGKDRPLRLERYALSPDQKELLIFTNSSRVWRQNTKGDYWVLDVGSGKLTQVSPDLPTSSLMFAKISPDGKNVGFVYRDNIYVQSLEPGGRRFQLTKDGVDSIVGGEAQPGIINGTFDWVYEEELDLRDGWRWSPDSKHIAYWQLDASKEPIYTLIDDTDALYPTVKRYPYPKAGQTNPSVRIGVVSAHGGITTWVDKTATSESGYLARMDWADNSTQLIIQSLNRAQNKDDYLIADAANGRFRVVYTDSDPAWIDILDTGTNGVRWVDGGKEFLVYSEHDGRRHVFEVPRDGAPAQLLTPGNYDVSEIAGVDDAKGKLYFNASPDNATQLYLYSAGLAPGSGSPTRLTPAGDIGTNEYSVSPTGEFAIHNWSSFAAPGEGEIVSLPDHALVRSLYNSTELRKRVAAANFGKAELIQLKTDDGQEMDASIIYPPDFDPSKKYPLFFNVYGEPAATTVHDSWGDGHLFDQMLAQKGYIIASVDNRGTPSLKGREWRKAIYKKIGTLTSVDQAAAAKQLIAKGFVDPARVGIWGWSGGGSTTLNMLFRYPDIYALGMSVAPVPDTHLYDSIYQERYEGLPQDNPQVYIDCSPITYAKNLKGKLLIVHGSGDDNVHYQGTERLVNELVRLEKPFQLMVYPNRSHDIREGPGTTMHLYELLVRFLTTNMPAGTK